MSVAAHDYRKYKDLTPGEYQVKEIKEIMAASSTASLSILNPAFRIITEKVADFRRFYHLSNTNSRSAHKAPENMRTFKFPHNEDSNITPCFMSSKYHRTFLYSSVNEQGLSGYNLTFII